MNDDRSRGETSAAAPSSASGAAPAPSEDQSSPPSPSPKERWYDRWLQRLNPRSRESVRDELEDALAESTDGESGFSPRERAMLQNVLGFHRIRVGDVMVPRADIVAVPAETSLGDLLAVFRTAGHSRLPVFGETLDDPKGMVHIRDFLNDLAARAEASGEVAGAAPNLGGIDLSVALADAKILRPVLFVPPSMPAIDLLVRMQATRTHMALVIDEYGGTDGLCSIEDLVETVVGDIEDEHDVGEARMVVRDADETYLADARASLDEVAEAIGAEIATEDMAEEVETLGGLVVTLAGRVPARGETIPGPDHLAFEIVDADPRRIKQVRIRRNGAAGNGTSDAAVAAGPAEDRGAALDPSPAHDRSTHLRPWPPETPGPTLRSF